MSENGSFNEPGETDILLPKNRGELEQLIQEVTTACGVEADDDASDFIATCIMHLPAHRGYAPKNHFANALIKGLANKTAYELLTELKQKRDAAAKAKAEAATPPPESAPVNGVPV